MRLVELVEGSNYLFDHKSDRKAGKFFKIQFFKKHSKGNDRLFPLIKSPLYYIFLAFFNCHRLFLSHCLLPFCMSEKCWPTKDKTMFNHWYDVQPSVCKQNGYLYLPECKLDKSKWTNGSPKKETMEVIFWKIKTTKYSNRHRDRENEKCTKMNSSNTKVKQQGPILNILQKLVYQTQWQIYTRLRVTIILHGGWMSRKVSEQSRVAAVVEFGLNQSYKIWA